MPEAEAVEGAMQGREPRPQAEATLQLHLKLGQRDVGRRLDDPHELRLVPGQSRRAVAAHLRRCRAARLAHPLHQLDRRRRAHREAPCRLTHRAATLDRAHDPLAQIHR
jgi:hypothetical protein